MVTALQVLGVAALALVVAAGIVGSWDPAKNISPTLVWIIWWVGTAYVSALVGNVWRLMNPWNATFAWAERAYRAITPDGELGMGWRYPAALGVWTGLVAFLAFAWVEIVYIDSALPGRITQFALLYTVYMWAGMYLYGREVWLRHGDAFSLVYGFLARFSPTELRVTDATVCAECSVDCADADGVCVDCAECFVAAEPESRELNIRPFVVGLLRTKGRSASVMVFVLLLLSTVSFDGFSATPAWGRLFNAVFTSVSGPKHRRVHRTPGVHRGSHVGLRAVLQTDVRSQRIPPAAGADGAGICAVTDTHCACLPSLTLLLVPAHSRARALFRLPRTPLASGGTCSAR